MQEAYSFISNSFIMFLVCATVIIVVLCQALIFLRAAWNRSLEIGIDKSDLKKIVVSSAVFAIVPSLPIIISYMLLLPSLGKFVPWLRLSVIGSAAYETMAANMAVDAMGYNSIGDSFSPEAFIMIFWAVTVGILPSYLSIFILKPFDSAVSSLNKKNNNFTLVLVPAMFLGLMGTISAPYLAAVIDPLNAAALLGSGISYLILRKLGTTNKAVKEFTFPVSMICGMAAVCIVNLFL